jgi:hypothetical protein
MKRAFSRIKESCGKIKKKKKKGNSSWNPNLDDRVLIKSQNQSDAPKGVIDKFTHVYQRRYIIYKILPH